VGDSPRLNFIFGHFGKLCPIFIGGVSRKDNRDEIVGVFMQEKVWLENSLIPLFPIGSGYFRVKPLPVQLPQQSHPGQIP
jgi:hypothetical protein